MPCNASRYVWRNSEEVVGKLRFDTQRPYLHLHLSFNVYFVLSKSIKTQSDFCNSFFRCPTYWAAFGPTKHEALDVDHEGRFVASVLLIL